MDKTIELPLKVQDDVVAVRQVVRRYAVSIGLSLVDQTKFVTAASELGRNTILHGQGGTAKLELLAYSVALTLRPKLAPAPGDEATAYDASLALTEGDVAGYWRPGKDSFFARITRAQLFSIARDTLGETWAGSRASDKKALLAEQLDRAFADPAKQGRTAGQVARLKSWLPDGMALTTAAAKPAKAKKTTTA